MSCEKISYEEKLRRNGIENLPHGRAIVEEYKGNVIWDAPDTSGPKIVIYTGYLEPSVSGWLHIHENNGKGFSVPRERVIRIEWDEKWRLNK